RSALASACISRCMYDGSGCGGGFEERRGRPSAQWAEKKTTWKSVLENFERFSKTRVAATAGWFGEPGEETAMVISNHEPRRRRRSASLSRRPCSPAPTR